MARSHGALNKTPDQLRQDAQRLLDRADRLEGKFVPTPEQLASSKPARYREWVDNVNGAVSKRDVEGPIMLPDEDLLS